MNILDKLSSELENKHLTEFEKVRYIYLRLCEIFSFDTRWYYTYLYNDDELHEDIKNKEFDLENIDVPLVVCHSFSNSILKPTIEYLTNLEVDVHNGGHSYCMLKYGNDSWKMDATIGDLARVKMGLATDGFTCNFIDYDKILCDMDNAIGHNYLKNEYYYEKMNYNSFLDIILSISKLLDESDCKYHYSDARHFYTSLAAIYSAEDLTYLEDKYKFIRLIKLVDDYSYLKMYKHNNEYKLEQINEEEYISLKKSLKHE